MIFKNAIFSILMFVLIGCSFNEITSFFEDKEVKLPGKRENVFDFKDDIIVKANKKILIDKPLPIDSWNQQFQNSRNHLSHFKSKPILKLKRKVSLGNILFEKINLIVQPVNLGENIFYADKNFNIISRNYLTGKLNWKTNLEREKKEKILFLGGMSLVGNSLVVTSGLGNIYLIDSNTGKKEWNKNFLVQFSRPPLIFKNKVFAVSDDNQTFCLNLKNGEIIWNHIGNLEEVSIIGGSKPAAIDNTVVLSYSSGEIYALDENDGSLIWFDNVGSSNYFSRSALNDIQSPLSIVDNKVYSPTFSDKLLVYDLDEGSKIWELKISSINQVTISGEALYIIDTLGKLLCLDSKTGKLLWSVQLKTNYDGEEIRWYGPLLTSNKLLVANSFGTILSLSPFTGKTLSKLNFDEEFILSPFQIKNEVFLISKKGTIFILG
ncbi:MAG: PQQ-binding-like beta-propeller repeat protein [Alphaproteobacteria bacterium]